MKDRVFTSSKPNTTTTNGTTTKPPPPPLPGAAATMTKPTNHYNPPSRPPYRPQPFSNRRHYPHHGTRTFSFCCCCLWTTITLLTLLLLAAIAACALYVLYRPLRPEFSIPSLHLLRLNLTADDHLSTLLNLTVVSKNPNSNIAFAYDAFTLTSSSSSSGVLLGNASVPGFLQDKKNVTTIRDIIVSGSYDLDSNTANALKSDLKRRNGNGSNGDVVLLKVLLDTKVTVTVGKVKSKRVGIRVTCDGIRGTVMKGKSPTVTVTSVSKNKCSVDLRIKIWNLTF